MEYKVGDRVRIKSIDWYNQYKGLDGNIACDYHTFTKEMSKFCGHTMIVCKRTNLGVMTMGGNASYWTDEMIEGLAEEPITLNGREVMLKLADVELPSGSTTIWDLPNGYIFKDENGNVISATKIILEKKSPKTDDVIKWLREHDMTKYIGVLCSGVCSITFDTEKLIKDINETIGDE
jgi:hypothetical protein